MCRNTLRFAVASVGLAMLAGPVVAEDVYVIHGINGLDVGAMDESLPVDVLVNGACALQGFTFRTIAGPLDLPPGDYEIEVKLADPDNPCGGMTVIGPATVPIGMGENVSIIAHLTADGMPTASKYLNDVSPVQFPDLRATVQHTAGAPAVDIVLNWNFWWWSFPALVIENLANPQQAGPALLWPGFYTVDVYLAGGYANGDDPVFDGIDVGFLFPGKLYSVYAVGSIGDPLTFELLPQVVKVGFDFKYDDDDDDDDDDNDDDD